ncbi:MAG: hypothetical protein ABJF23_33545 [Bryobacteraceae bacterium]
MNLKTSLPKVAPIQPTEEMERRIMGNKHIDEPVYPEVHEDVRKDISTPQVSRGQSRASSARNVRREGTILLNAKIPVSLHTRLKRTSQYNDVSMTDILLRGIEAELESGHYSVPPETWGTDER